MEANDSADSITGPRGKTKASRKAPSATPAMPRVLLVQTGAGEVSGKTNRTIKAKPSVPPTVMAVDRAKNSGTLWPKASIKKPLRFNR